MLIKSVLFSRPVSGCAAPVVLNRLVVLIGGQSHQQKRYINKNYDKVVKLYPPRIEYKYKDSKFFDARHLEDEPYLQRTDEEIADIQTVKLEKDYPNRHWTPVDINEEPFRQVLSGTEDNGKFTETETIADKSRWFWVERLLPKPPPEFTATDEPVDTPSGWRPPPKTKPNLDYFIPRTRNQLFPVYRRYQIEGRNKEEYWKNRWDGLFNSYHKELLKKLDDVKFENNESTITLTLIVQIKGNIWQFEEDLRGALEEQYGRRILSAIHEPNGVLRLKGDFVNDCVKWLSDKGF